MLITVYQLRHKRFVPVREYYWWNLPTTPEEDFNQKPPKEPCPGCGKPQTKYTLRTEHVCDGSLTTRPANNMRYLRNRLWNPKRGEPDSEGCPVPTAREVRSIYNQDTNAKAQQRKLSIRLQANTVHAYNKRTV